MKENIRIGYGEHITKLGKDNKDIILLEGDLADSTCSDIFQLEHPDRHFQMGIAEQNMVGVAAGLALEGKIPIVNTFAAFIAMRACEQVRTSVAYPNLNVKFVVSHAGVSAGSAGPTHHTLEDIAIMNALPNFNVLVPSDSVETKSAIKTAIATDGPFYIRLSRPPTPILHDKEDFKLGKGEIINEGKDATIIACGIMVSEAIVAAENLATGRSCRSACSASPSALHAAMDRAGLAGGPVIPFAEDVAAADLSRLNAMVDGLMKSESELKQAAA